MEIPPIPIEALVPTISTLFGYTLNHHPHQHQTTSAPSRKAFVSDRIRSAAFPSPTNQVDTLCSIIDRNGQSQLHSQLIAMYGDSIHGLQNKHLFQKPKTGVIVSMLRGDTHPGPLSVELYDAISTMRKRDYETMATMGWNGDSTSDGNTLTEVLQRQPVAKRRRLGGDSVAPTVIAASTGARFNLGEDRNIVSRPLPRKNMPLYLNEVTTSTSGLPVSSPGGYTSTTSASCVGSKASSQSSCKYVTLQLTYLHDHLQHLSELAGTPFAITHVSVPSTSSMSSTSPSSGSQSKSTFITNDMSTTISSQQSPTSLPILPLSTTALSSSILTPQLTSRTTPEKVVVVGGIKRSKTAIDRARAQEATAKTQAILSGSWSAAANEDAKSSARSNDTNTTSSSSSNRSNERSSRRSHKGGNNKDNGRSRLKGSDSRSRDRQRDSTRNGNGQALERPLRRLWNDQDKDNDRETVRGKGGSDRDEVEMGGSDESSRATGGGHTIGEFSDIAGQVFARRTRTMARSETSEWKEGATDRRSRSRSGEVGHDVKGELSENDYVDGHGGEDEVGMLPNKSSVTRRRTNDIVRESKQRSRRSITRSDRDKATSSELKEERRHRPSRHRISRGDMAAERSDELVATQEDVSLLIMQGEEDWARDHTDEVDRYSIDEVEKEERERRRDLRRRKKEEEAYVSKTIQKVVEGDEWAEGNVINDEGMLTSKHKSKGTDQRTTTLTPFNSLLRRKARGQATFVEGDGIVGDTKEEGEVDLGDEDGDDGGDTRVTRRSRRQNARREQAQNSLRVKTSASEEPEEGEVNLVEDED